MSNTAIQSLHLGAGHPELTAGRRVRMLPRDRSGRIGLNAAAAAPDQHQQLTKQAQKWVSQTFYGTLLKQMHNSPFRSELFDGGRGGQAFSPLLDQQLADRMSRAVGGKLVKGIVRKIEARNKKHANDLLLPSGPGKEPAKSNVQGDNPFENVRTHVPPNLRA